MKLNIVLFLFIISSVASAQNFRLRAKDKSFNPQIGVNATFLDQTSSREKEADGISLSEVELQFTSDIDTNFAGTVLLGIHKHAEGHEEENKSGAEEHEEEGFTVDAEEVFVETISIPNISFKVGKSRQPFGKHNRLHFHAFPFINAPLVNQELFGEDNDGLTEIGYGASGLLPLSWFSELTLNYVQGDNEQSFGSKRKSNKAIVANLKNLWDLSDATTLEFGSSFAEGQNEDATTTQLVGFDLTLKWRPTSGGKFASIEWMTEYLKRNKEGSSDKDIAGIVSHLKYQFKERWYTQYRYDYLGLEDLSDVHGKQRHTALLAYVPSEFSAFRLQYEHLKDAEEKDDNKVSLQMVISIGAHPAHNY